MAEIKNGVGVPVKASPSDEIVLTNAPDHEKQLKRIFALLNAGGKPARITEALAQTIIDDVTDMQMSHNGMVDALKHERAETKILSVALSEIYRSLYGYEPTRLFPIEDTMINIRSRIEQLKDKTTDKERETLEWLTESIREIGQQLEMERPADLVRHTILEIKAEIERREKAAYIDPRQVDKLRTEQDSAKKHILDLTECLRDKPFAGDTSSLTLEEAINLLSIALANRRIIINRDDMYDEVGLRDSLQEIYETFFPTQAAPADDEMVQDLLEHAKRQARGIKPSAEVRDAMLRAIWNVLYPDGDMDNEWSSDELDEIASILRPYKS